MSSLTVSSTLTILIVDDKPSNLQLLLEYLKKANYKILIAQTGLKAIETAIAFNPNLILLDVMMGQMDGFDTCRKLKSTPSTKNIPIIFLTVLSTTKSKVKGFELGAVDYVIKPIDESELLARIHTHLSLQSLHQRLAREVAQRKLIFNISDRIRSSLNLKTILKTAAQEIRTFLECDFVGLFTLADRQVEIQAYSAAENLKIESIVNNLTLNYLRPNSQEYDFYLQENVKLIKDTATNSCQITPLQSPQAQLIVPIVINSEILWGWLVVEQYSSSRQWFPEEINLLKEITTQLAIGIKQGLLYQKLSQLALFDPLTQIYNRRYFDRQLNLEWRRLMRNSAPLSLVMCDVDCFKIFNDTYGHQQGDRCLRQIAKAISSVTKRPADVVARYGGEEFIIILPNTPQSGAMKVAELMRVAVKQLNIAHLNSNVDPVVTISLGVATTIPSREENPYLLVEAADRALYRAKQSGKNCIAVYPDSIEQKPSSK